MGFLAFITTKSRLTSTLLSQGWQEPIQTVAILNRTIKWWILINYMGSNNQTSNLLPFIQVYPSRQTRILVALTCSNKSSIPMTIKMLQLLTSKLISLNSFINDCWCNRWTTNRGLKLHKFPHLIFPLTLIFLLMFPMKINCHKWLKIKVQITRLNHFLWKLI